MLNAERIDYILAEIRREKAVVVAKLAKKLYASEATIRRDLSILEKEGLVRRTYGGAVLPDLTRSETPFAVRGNHAAKELVGMLAAKLVRDDMVIFMDSSSTVMHMVKYLSPVHNLRIITTSPQTTLNCLDTLDAQIYCTGGLVHSYSRGFIGEGARASIAGFNADLAFFSARAVSIEAGATDINEDEVILRQWMMQRSKEAVLLCDSSKFDQASFKIICALEKLDALVTERNPGDAWLAALRAADVKAVYPDEASI